MAKTTTDLTPRRRAIYNVLVEHKAESPLTALFKINRILVDARREAADEAVSAKVLDAPSSPVPQAPDRDALASARRRIGVLYMAGSGGKAAALDLRLAIDEIDAALARPASGVWLTPEDAALIAFYLNAVAAGKSFAMAETLRALAERLEQETRAWPGGD